jgi:hypothetical protein
MTTRASRSCALLVVLCLTGCAGSILFAVKRAADQALICDCDTDEEHEEISAKVKGLSEKEIQFHRYYRAWCCGKEVFLECQAQVRAHHTATSPPYQQQGPSGDIAWSCWTTEDPTQDRIRPKRTPEEPQAPVQ